MTFNVTPNPLGSVLFNGTTQYLTLSSASASAWNFLHNGLQDYTVEAWIYMTTIGGVNSSYTIISSGTGTIDTGMFFDVSELVAGDMSVWILRGVSGTQNVWRGTGAVITPNTWNHVAFTFQSSTKTGTIYVNGVNKYSATQSSLSYSSANSTYPLAIGRYQYSVPGGYFPGYISNLRISNTIVYTGTFIPPTAPLTGTQPAGTNISAITGIQTSLLLQTPNNASFITDSSIYNVTLTNNGTATANALTPFSGAAAAALTMATDPLGSVSFNGGTQYLLSATNAALAFGTGDFTVECWWYQSVSNAGRGFLNSIAAGLGATGYGFQLCGDGAFTGGNAGGSYDTFSWTLPLNQWNHVALVRISGTAYAYVNGIRASTGATSIGNNLQNNQVSIGSSYTNNFSFLAAGSISNVRLVKGVGVYTGNFTPPTLSLRGTQAAGGFGSNISAINAAQTSLLLQTPNTASFITDSSIYAVTMTNTGTSPASALSPFSTISPTVWNGLTLGAGGFNGTSQSLTTTVTTSSSLDLATGAGNWTIESWFYLTSVAGSASVVWKTAGANPAYCFWISTTTLQWIVGDGAGGGVAQNLATAIAANNWYHFALVRNSNTLTPYLNGVAGTAVTMAFTQGNGGASTTLYVGAASDGRFFPGYISNTRITKGVAVYTGAFTPPNQPLTTTQPAGTNISAITGTQTSLLLNTWANFTIYDSSGQNSITNNGSATSSPFTPFATTAGPVAMSYTNPALATTGSWYFSNTSLGYLNLTASTPRYSFGTGDFTAEFWMYTPALGSNYSPVSFFSAQVGGAGYITGQWEFQLTNNAGGLLTMVYATSSSTTGYIQASGAVVSAGQWWHIALVRIGSGINNMKIYVNGTVAGQNTVTQVFGTTGAGTIGLTANGSVANYFYGYITNLRLVNGVGVYTGAFTPSTSPLTITQPAGANIAAITSPSSTTLLASIPTSTNRQFYDSSVYNNGPTFNNATGNVTTSLSSPFTSLG